VPGLARFCRGLLQPKGNKRATSLMNQRSGFEIAAVTTPINDTAWIPRIALRDASQKVPTLVAQVRRGFPSPCALLIVHGLKTVTPKPVSAQVRGNQLTITLEPKSATGIAVRHSTRDITRRRAMDQQPIKCD
jgi:hypothetical protein